MTVEHSVRTQFDETIEVLRSHDADKARALMQTYTHETSATCDRLVNAIVEGKVGDQPLKEGAATVPQGTYTVSVPGHVEVEVDVQPPGPVIVTPASSLS